MNHLPNLLIVDDDEENLIYLETIIKKIKVNLIQARSGSEALEKTRGIELALAIIDIRMPGMNGYELALKLNEERAGEKVPIIFLTASHVNKVQIIEGYDSGAVDYLFKPINNQILLSKINVFLDLFNQKQIIIRDAAQLKKFAEELTSAVATLKTSEEKYRSYVDNAPDGVFIVDETGKYVEVNEAASRITGYSKEELLNMTINDVLPKESLMEGLAQFGILVKSGSSKADLPFLHKNGTTRWWSLDAVKLSETRFLGFTKDITHRKEMEETLRIQYAELEMQNDELSIAIDKAKVATEKYTDLYDFAPTGYFSLSTDFKILALNYTGARLLGKDRLRLINSHFGFFLSINSLQVFNAFFQNILKSETKETCEVVLETDGNNPPKYLHIEGVAIRNGEQCLLNVVDVTNRKLAEKAVNESERLYHTLLNASPDGVFLIDLKGIITEVSEIGVELFGADSRDDLVGTEVFRFVPSDEKNTIKELIEKATNEGLVQNVGIKIRKKNLTVFAGETSATLIQSPDGAPIAYMITLRDISHRKKMETKQIHADRMANLGEMASGIAHEINQPLNIISMVMDKIIFEAAKTDKIDIDFFKIKSDKIFENIIRIRNIIDHIRAFSRSHHDYILTDFDINKSIENAASMINEQFKHLDINLILQLEKQIPPICGNTYKFEQVVINLLTNAKDALMEKKNQQGEIFDMIVGIRSYQEDQTLVVEVTDNGIGISNDDINNILLPFYTTKDEGKGTGLGLSICYQIIKEMDGTIGITSEKSNGTFIKLILNIKEKK
jgi:PAS domain S-box-containing protein